MIKICIHKYSKWIECDTYRYIILNLVMWRYRQKICHKCGKIKYREQLCEGYRPTTKLDPNKMPKGGTALRSSSSYNLCQKCPFKEKTLVNTSSIVLPGSARLFTDGVTPKIPPIPPNTSPIRKRGL